MTIVYIDDKAVPLIEGAGGGCFSKDTLILCKIGVKPISEIEVGDKVQAYDENGQLSVSQVTETFYHPIDVIYRVTHENGYLDITPNHWVLKDDGTYQELKDFSVGDYLLTTDNSRSKILSIEYLGNDEVFNFKVSHYHSYIANGIKVHNGGGGGKGSGGGSEVPNSLFSTDIVFLTLGLGEGPVYRINPNGPLDIEFNEGLIEDLLIDGVIDTEKFFVLSNTGTLTQKPLPLFGDYVITPQRLSGGVELKKGNATGVPRSAIDNQNTTPTSLSALKFYFIISGLQAQNNKGNIVGRTVEVGVDIFSRQGVEIASQTRTIKGKTNVAYSFDIFVKIPEDKISEEGYKFSVYKLSDDSSSSKIQEQITFQGWSEIIEQPTAYPRTATIGYALKAFAEHRGSIPTITNMVKGLLVKVPSNYNQPILLNGEIDWRQIEVADSTRAKLGYRQQKTGSTVLTDTNPVIYDGLWDGQFVYSWTQNPAWIVYDLLTNKAHGIGIPEENIDKYSFYKCAVYNDACDINTGRFYGISSQADGTYRYKPRTYKQALRYTLEGLPRGTPVLERRFIYDGVLANQQPLLDVIAPLTLTFRAVLFYKGGKIYLHQDAPDDMPVALFNETNILKDTFTISGINEEELITGVDISYTDATNHYRNDILRIDDARALDERNGIENIATIQLEGVTRKSQAARLAQYVIADKKYSRRKLSFKTGIEASDIKPGDIISVSQRAATVAWGFGGIVAIDSEESNSNVTLEHIGVPAITDSVFTSNTKPLALRIASTTSGLVDTYIISNTSYTLTSTDNVSSGADLVQVSILSKYNHPTKSFSAFSTYGDSHLPRRFDLWSLGEINDLTNIYTSLTDKLFRVIGVDRDKDETITLEASEYISNVYVDSDTLIDYQPLFFDDLYSPLQTPPVPNFNLRAVPKRDLDGSVYTDLEINSVTDRGGYSNEIRTEFYMARPPETLILVSNSTPQASRNIVKLHVDDMTGVADSVTATLYGKNGYTTTFAQSKLLVTSYSIVEVDVINKPYGNISFNVSGLNELVDLNFTAANNGVDIHSLHVNDIFDLGDLKGVDKVSVPINQKEVGGEGDALGLLGFIGSDTQLADYSANVVAIDLATNTLKIDNDSSGDTAISSILPSAPFYISIPQPIDFRYFANNSLYVAGHYIEFIRTNVASVSNLVEEHLFKQPLGVSVKNTNFVDVFINNIPHENFSLETGLDELANSQVSISLNTLPTEYASLDVRVVANVYSVPVIERGDNLFFSVGNVFGVSNTTFDIADGSYSEDLTSNGIFRITLDNSINSNVTNSILTNITPNPIGVLGNVDSEAKTFTFEFPANRFPGLYNLANNKIYQINAPLSDFMPLDIEPGATTRAVNRVSDGVYTVKARNVNKYGRKSEFVTKTITVRPIPIQAVTNLTVSDEIYRDSSIGIATRIIASFDHITGQEVTDYEISYKLVGTATGDLTSYNTVKVSAAGVDDDGKIRFKIDNVEKGLSVNPNNIVIKVTPLNKNIRGSTLVLTHEIVGKSAPPQNVHNFAVGQSGDSLIFAWQYQLDPITGDNIDIDLMEVYIRKVEGTIATDQDTLLDLWPRIQEVVKVDARTNRVVIDIDQYGEYTYLVRTKDTSGNFSESIVATSYISSEQTFTTVYKAYSEDDPSVSYITGITNENSTENYYPSFADSNTGGLSYNKADSPFDSSIVDNANGTSSGWSVVSGDDTNLLAYSDAIYQTQLRDIGTIINGSLSVDIVGEQSVRTTWLDYSTQIGEDQVTESAPTGKLRDIDFAGALGIGNILGYANTSAATVTYNSINKSLVSGKQGTAPANVFGIIALGNYDGDEANANVLSLIAGVDNATAITLGQSWYANGISTGSNGFANLTVAGTAYKLVNLKQWIDLPTTATFYGTSGLVTSRLLVRTSTDDPYYANGNVDISTFSTTDNDGFTDFAVGSRTFRYFQFRYEVTNSSPTEVDFVLDKFRYKVNLNEKTFTDVVSVSSQITQVDYSKMAYSQTPKITGAIVTASSNQLAQPQVIIIDRTTEAANISVYFSNGKSAHNIGGTVPEVDFSVTGV